jgi:pimeloyl-ACP methyl ester carboxylesterase
LSDSPAGQLAWIVDKMHDWVHGPMEQALDRDEILTNVMFYWITGTGGSAARMYYENMHATPNWGRPPSRTPVGVAAFAEDIAIRRYGEQANNIIHWSDFERGGHFAAMEAPDLLVDDVRAFFRKLR